MWVEFHSFFINLVAKNEVPIHFIRYEDLAAKPTEVITGVLKFLLEVESLRGTVAE